MVRTQIRVGLGFAVSRKQRNKTLLVHLLKSKAQHMHIRTTDHMCKGSKSLW